MKLQFRATLALFLLLLLSYFWFSKGEYFIPAETLSALAFSALKPLNFLSFILIHTGLSHLIVNLLSIACFGLIVEGKLNARDVTAVFVVSAIISGIVFLLLNPGTGLIGASSGISGLIAAAVLLKPRQAAIAIITVLVVSNIGVLILTEGLEKMPEKEIKKIEREIQKAVEEKDAEKEAELKTELEAKQLSAAKIKAGVITQKLIRTDALVHAAGALVGIAYLRVFRQKIFFEAIRNYGLLFKKTGL